MSQESKVINWRAKRLIWAGAIVATVGPFIPGPHQRIYETVIPFLRSLF